MKKSQADQTTAKNLEENGAVGNRDMAGDAARVAVDRCGKQLRYRFDRGEEVLDYFEVTKARVMSPRSKGSVVKKFAYPAKRNSDRRATVREKSARYRKK